MQAVKVTGSEIESIMHDLGENIKEHKTHHRDTCPLCCLMNSIESDEDTEMRALALFRSIACIINPAILIMNQDLNEAEKRTCAMLLMIGIMIGRKQVEVEQLKRM
jgi:hypothetical protein